MKILIRATFVSIILSLLLVFIPAETAFSDIPIQYNALYATAGDDLWLIDETTGSTTLVGPIGFQGTDVAYNGKDLYGISFSDFYRIDPNTGMSVLIGSMGFSGVNALTISLDGTGYAAT